MLKIGITGGIGSGKSTVCRVFECLGIPVFYADTVAKEIMVKDALLIAGLRDAFGKESYFDDGSLNNKHIAGIVFNNKAQLAKLNSLVHPAVFRAYDAWALGLPAEAPYALKEAALLFESGSYRMSDKNILVTAALELKLARVMQRDNVTEDQVRARMDKQFTDEQKLEMTDYVIYNDEKTSLIDQVLEMHRLFLKLAQ